MTHSIQLAAIGIRAAIPRNRALWLGLALLGLISISACSATPRNVWVYIDNAGNQVLEITVDGQLAATVAPDDFAKLVYPPGEHRFLIKAGGEALCDVDRNLEPSNRIGMARKYLFNPDKLTRYQTYDVK